MEQNIFLAKDFSNRNDLEKYIKATVGTGSELNRGADHKIKGTRKQLKKLKNKESKENAEFLDISEKEQRLNKRDDKIKELYKEGLSLAQIGKKVGLTRQRISQVVNSNKKEDGKE